MSKIRNVLGAALLGIGLVSTAQAAVTVLDFENYLDNSVVTLTSGISPTAGVVRELLPGDILSTQYADLGLSFSTGNVIARNINRPGGNVVLPVSPPNGSPNFLMNSAAGASFVVNVLAGFHLDSLMLDIAYNSAGVGITVNNSISVATFFGGSLLNWSADRSILLPVGVDVRSIEFRASGSDGRFGVDLMRLSLTPTGGSVVPEPAALGLVMLALLGVAASSRRRTAA